MDLINDIEHFMLSDDVNCHPTHPSTPAECRKGDKHGVRSIRERQSIIKLIIVY